MAYIRTIPPEEADEQLAKLYKRVGNPDGSIDEVMLVHSLSVESLRAHFELYVTAMHRPSPLSRAEREIVGTIVSRLNGCDYCVAHHAAGLRRALPNERKHIADALTKGDEAALDAREGAMADYARRLTEQPGSVTRAHIAALRDVGLDDRAILDLAQVVAYFCYANRIVLGLGAKLESFEAGQHPAID